MATLKGTSRKPDEVVATVNITGGARKVTDCRYTDDAIRCPWQYLSAPKPIRRSPTAPVSPHLRDQFDLVVRRANEQLQFIE